MKKFKNKNAFSIVEIMLVLLILGIVIIMALPVIIHSYKKSVTAVILKDTYRELNSGIANLSVKNKCFGDLVCKDLLSNFGKKLSSQYQTIKFCEKNGGCWKDKVYLNLNNSTDYKNINSEGQSFIDSKGKIYNVVIEDTNCNTDLSEDADLSDKVPQKHKLKHSCGYITVDIDGNKKINKYGIDVFKFIITNSKNTYLYPYGGKYHKEYWKTKHTCQPEDSHYDGQSCAGRIMDENWKINYFNE